jgi:hypothetical protein
VTKGPQPRRTRWGRKAPHCSRRQAQCLLVAVQDNGFVVDEWVVWRQDDNGNRYVVRRLPTLEEAERLAAELEARGHKQLYWVVAPDR